MRIINVKRYDFDIVAKMFFKKESPRNFTL